MSLPGSVAPRIWAGSVVLIKPALSDPEARRITEERFLRGNIRLRLQALAALCLPPSGCKRD